MPGQYSSDEATNSMQTKGAETASFFVHEVMADTMGLGAEELESSHRRALRALGLLGMAGYFK